MTESGRARLDSLFASAQAEDRPVLLPYLTAGLPSVEESIDLFVAMADAGADGFEVGIPYADPLMDGPVIMEAGERALASGITVERSLEVVAGVVERTGKPVVVMTYVNPVLRNGIDDFMARVAAAGASGVILADLPADEAGPFSEAAARAGLGMVLFVAPTTDDDRIADVVGAEPVFVYAVAEIGITGERERASDNLDALATRIRRAGDVPIVFGVGISTPDQAQAAGGVGDGVIIGSAIVRRVLEAPDAAGASESLAAFVGNVRSTMG